MPNITLSIPDDRISSFLRLVADFLDDAERSPLNRPSVPPPGGRSDHNDWNVTSADPDGDDDFGLLVDYYRRLSPTATRILDELIDNPEGAEASALTFIVGLETMYALSGSVGHAAKVAGELGRSCPIQIDKDSGRYWVLPDLVDAIRQARLWSAKAPYTHNFVGPVGDDESQQLSFPARYAMWAVGEDEVQFFRTRDDLIREEPEAFDEAAFVVVEFKPEHSSGELIERRGPTANRPTMGGE